MCREVSDARILLIFHFLNSSKIKANLDKNLQFRNKGRNCLDPAFFFFKYPTTRNTSFCG